jgi:hypothetical protein
MRKASARRLATAAIAASGLFGRRAWAEGVPRYHDQLYLRFAAGLAYFSDAVKSEELPVFGVASGTIRGVAPLAEVAAGYTVARGLVVGGALRMHLIPSPVTSNGHSNLGDFPEDVDFGSTTLIMVGPMVDYYPDPSSGLHVQGSIGYGVLTLGEGRGSSTDRQYVQNQSGGGLALNVGVGYELWVSGGWSVGALGTLTAGWGSGNDLQGYAWTHNVLIPGLLVSATMN